MNIDDVSPDPVTEPAAYQQYLLDLLGDDDPADAQESTAATLRGLAKEAGTFILQQPVPASGRWVR